MMEWKRPSVNLSNGASERWRIPNCFYLMSLRSVVIVEILQGGFCVLRVREIGVRKCTVTLSLDLDLHSTELLADRRQLFFAYGRWKIAQIQCILGRQRLWRYRHSNWFQLVGKHTGTRVHCLNSFGYTTACAPISCIIDESVILSLVSKFNSQLRRC